MGTGNMTFGAKIGEKNACHSKIEQATWNPVRGRRYLFRENGEGKFL